MESTEEVEGGERQGLMEGEEKMEEKREVEEETGRGGQVEEEVRTRINSRGQGGTSDGDDNVAVWRH